MIHRAGLGIACALGAAAIYGLIPNFARAAFENGVPAIESTFFRTSLVAVAFAIAAVAAGDSLSIPRQARPAFRAQALATGGVSICYLTSIQFIPVGLAVIIFFTFPVIILLLSPLVERRWPGPVKIVIALSAFLGLGVAVGPGFDSLDWRGLALAALGALSATMQFFSGRWISKHMTPVVFGARVHLAIWPMTLALALYFGNGKLQSLPGGSATGVGYLFLVALSLLYIASYFAQMLSLRYAPASTVAPFFNLEPVVTTAIAGLLLGERLAANQYVGGLMVLAALIASSFADMRKFAARQMPRRERRSMVRR